MKIQEKVRADLYGECDECRESKAKFVWKIQCLHFSLCLCRRCFRELKRQIKLVRL